MKRIKVPLNCDSKTAVNDFLGHWEPRDAAEFKTAFSQIDEKVQELDTKLGEVFSFFGLPHLPEASRLEKLKFLEQHALTCIRPEHVLEWWLEAFGQARCAANRYEALWHEFQKGAEKDNWMPPLLLLADWLTASALDFQEIMDQDEPWRIDN